MPTFAHGILSCRKGSIPWLDTIVCCDWSLAFDHHRYPSRWRAVAVYPDEDSMAVTSTALTVATDVRERDQFWTVEWAFLF